MATTNSGALAHRTVGDIFQGDIPSSTTEANGQDIRVACIAVVQLVQPRA
jgi:hypothetical protein